MCRYNDGCNTCSVANGVLGGCTEMMCFRQGTPFCSQYSDGRACTSATDCTQGAASGGGAAEGAHCSTSATRGNPNGVPCAAGLNCQITMTGMRPAADVGNSGVCVDPARPIAVDPMPYPGMRPQPPMQQHPTDPMPPMHPTDPIAVAQPASDFCPASRRQSCRMLCPAPTCTAGQCAMRAGSCCDFTCQASNDAVVLAPVVAPVYGATTTGACTAATANVRPMPGAFVAQCDENGDYMPVQCHGSIGSCWCTDASGTEIQGTRVNSRGGQVLDIATCAAASHPDMVMIDDGFGMPVDPSAGAPVAAGGRCASGFCENPSDCPQCAAGSTCSVQPGMMCAGTCYGTCSKGH